MARPGRCRRSLHTLRSTLLGAANDLVQLVEEFLQLAAPADGVRGPAQGPERQPPLYDRPGYDPFDVAGTR